MFAEREETRQMILRLSRSSLAAPGNPPGRIYHEQLPSRWLSLTHSAFCSHCSGNLQAVWAVRACPSKGRYRPFRRRARASIHAPGAGREKRRRPRFPPTADKIIAGVGCKPMPANHAALGDAECSGFRHGRPAAQRGRGGGVYLSRSWVAVPNLSRPPDNISLPRPTRRLLRA